MPRRASPFRPLLLLAALTVTLVLLGAVLYWLGMRHLEGTPRTFLESLGWASETLSTTGYGADSRWQHPAMVLFVVVMQIAGVFLIVLVFPLYLIPALEARFETRLPTAIPELAGHLLIYRHGPAVSGLLARARQRDVPVVVLEEDEAEARRLLEQHGVFVVFGQLDDGLVARGRLAQARALVVNGSDDQNAAVVLEARQLGFSGEVVALVEEPFHRQPILLAGASAAFTPRHILGAALAARASDRIDPTVAGIRQLGRRLRVAEVRIHASSPLAGQTLTTSRLGSTVAVHAIGLWRGGELHEAHGGLTMTPGSILVAVGREENLEELARRAGQSSLRRPGPVIIAGYGEVGQKVAQLLTDAGERVRVVDRHSAPGVDVVGNVLDQRVLEQLAPATARAVVLALDNDSATLFAAVIVRELAAEVPILARVNRTENVEKIHRAGADFALSIGAVSGQMLAHRLLGEEALAVGARLAMVRAEAPALVGVHPATAEVRQRTGASVVAVERGDEVIVDFDPEFRFAAEDAIYICGTPESARRFRLEFAA